MRIKAIDRIGEKYNRLTIISIAKSENNRTFFNCLCDCGNSCTIESGHIFRKTKPTGSCGCLLLDFLHRNINKDPWPIEFKRWKYVNIRNRPHIALDITFEQWKILSHGNCYYCGCPPKRTTRSGQNNEDNKIAGIDRKDNAIGYTIDNCVSACWTCNKLKNVMSDSDFLEAITNIYTHQHKS